jgi:EAL domain-containing protein (putative c-di-GMP-specific phosphodiesterase class I)/FixJ family two-component response regulator
MREKNINILVLDDEAFMLKLLERMLVNLGYNNIVTCDNSVKALNYICEKNTQPDLILCDLMMPEMDGIEIVNHLIENCYTGNLILVSGIEERIMLTVEKLAHTNNIRILGSLHKPFTTDCLSVLLDKVTPHKESMRKNKKIYSVDEVRNGIKNNELINHYQPQINISSGKVVGVESLVRWQHPIDGMVYPDQFIGIAEENNLIDDLTKVVMVNAFKQTKCWNDDRINIRVAVNISMDNLKSLDFPDLVADIALSTGISAHDIILEVTESRLMADPRASLGILTRLCLKGFSLSIDDFGTGHSSFTQLHNIPFNELKVDQSFVHGAGTNNTTMAIYNASLSLARQLNMEVVAEGIEDKNDWNFVKSSSCQIAQGYFIAKPMPAEDITDLLSKPRFNNLD